MKRPTKTSQRKNEIQHHGQRGCLFSCVFVYSLLALRTVFFHMLFGDNWVKDILVARTFALFFLLFFLLFSAPNIYVAV